MILIFKGLTVRRIYKSFSVKGLMSKSMHLVGFSHMPVYEFKTIVIIFSNCEEIKHKQMKE
jgi:hypothetical protein